MVQKLFSLTESTKRKKEKRMAASPATATPNPNPRPNPTVAGDWTIVCRRRRRRRHPITLRPRIQTVTLTLTPSPWSPADPTMDADRVSRILSRLHAAISLVESSPFYRRFLSRLRGPHMRRLLSSLAAGGAVHLVVYGVGSFESHLPSRLQLALSVLLRRDLHVAAAEVFDPVLSAAECAAAAALGLSVAHVDEGCRRRAAGPTVFYMPHCEAALYDALLGANWRPAAALRRVAVLGNSFAGYARQAALGGPAGVAAGAAPRVLVASRFATELGMEDTDVDGRRGGCLQDEGDGFFRAFQDTSWHFFEVDDEAELDAIGR